MRSTFNDMQIMVDSCRPQRFCDFYRLGINRIFGPHPNVTRRKLRGIFQWTHTVITTQGLVLLDRKIELLFRLWCSERSHSLMILKHAVEQYANTNLWAALL